MLRSVKPVLLLLLLTYIFTIYVSLISFLLLFLCFVFQFHWPINYKSHSLTHTSSLSFLINVISEISFLSRNSPEACIWISAFNSKLHSRARSHEILLTTTEIITYNKWRKNIQQRRKHIITTTRKEKPVKIISSAHIQRRTHLRLSIYFDIQMYRRSPNVMGDYYTDDVHFGARFKFTQRSTPRMSSQTKLINI